MKLKVVKWLLVSTAILILTVSLARLINLFNSFTLA